MNKLGLNKKHTIEEMRTIAHKWGGECLSETYLNVSTRLKWKCNEGHIFEATPSKILMGRWCRICRNKAAAKSRRISMEEITKIAESRNGKCLSEEYNPNEKLEWQCEFGHRWLASIHNVKAGHWCPVCGHKKSGRTKLNIEEMQEIAKSHGGKCLSKEYINVETKLEWMCSKGHVWKAIPSSVKKGHWCPICAGQQRKTISDAQELAESRGGYCLSTKFYGVHKKIKWQCSEGHTWFATYANIQTGRWCPECSNGLGERICRSFFEQIFNSEFPKTRPEWLINDDGYQMELDGYCDSLSLAFEHQGQQHYKELKYFHSSEKDFQKRKDDDRKKVQLCKTHNVILIAVPQIPDDLPLTKIQHFIIQECRSRGINIPSNRENIKINLQQAFSYDGQEILSSIREIAVKHEGECLSTVYLGSSSKLRFKCKEGHVWETIPEVIRKGHWCPKCSADSRGKKRRLTIEEMDKIAESRGGRCLSREYVNANTHLLWECSEGHQWKAIPNSIKRGSWCPICAKAKRKHSHN